MKYKASISISGQDVQTIHSSIHSFHVDGGANRTIVLSSTNDFSISSEFEQARSNKNITFLVPPAKNFTAVDLIALKTPKHKYFKMQFMIMAYPKAGADWSQMLVLATGRSWLKDIPQATGDKERMLSVRVAFDDAKIRHHAVVKESRDKVEIVETEM